MCYPADTMKNRLPVILLLSLTLLASGCVQSPLLPTASFTLSPNSGPSPLIVTFNASTSHSTNGVIAQYIWDFGDGQAGNGIIVSHSYESSIERTFTVTLQVADQQGALSSVTDNVLVQAPSENTEGPSVEFVWPFHYDAEGDDAANLNDEYFTLRTTGEEGIDLSGWRVENDRGDTFILPEGIRLTAGTDVTIHSGSGANSSTHLYLHATAPVWDAGDLATLRNADGQIVDYYLLVSC